METNANEVVWCISGDGERFYETECVKFQDAITEGLRQYRKALRGQDTDCFAPGACPVEEAVFYIGTKAEFVPVVDADSVIDQLQCEADDYCGEFADDYLSYLTDDQRAVLQTLLQQAFDCWQLAFHLEPSFFLVEGSTKVRVEDHKDVLAALCCHFGSGGTATERVDGYSEPYSTPELPKGSHEAM